MTKESINTATRELKRRLIQTFSPETEIYLFGSAARGDYGASSDIDILVLLPFEPDTATEERIFDLAYDVELEYGMVFGLIVYSKVFWDSEIARTTPLHKNIEREGVGV